jgi:type II secretory ATPase GspE/PulE/Tfp pilus assembly ATPase PilB-like protein
MTQEIILEMIDRQSINATLAEPFTPSNNQIIVNVGKNDQLTSFQLADVSCIRMKSCPDWAPSKHDESKHEEIETTSGITFYASVPEKQQFQTGFFAFSIEESSEFHFLFFSFIGTRSRKLFTQLGEILEKSGTVSPDNIKKALTEQKRQKDMRLGEIISEKQGVPLQTINDTIKRMLNNKKVPPRARIGDILVAAGLVSRDQIDQTLSIQKNNKSKQLGELLIEQQLVTEEQILVALASKFRIPYMDLKDITPTPQALKLISPEIVEKLHILPIKVKGHSLVIATSDPADHAAISDALRFHAQHRIDLVVSLKDVIADKISEIYQKEEEAKVDEIIDEISEDDVSLEEESDEYAVNEADSKLIRVLNKILIDGFTQEASDIHIEPGIDRDPIKVRYRVDGICHVAHNIPRIYSRAIISRLKIMATLDISERRRPQSGKIVIRYAKKKIEYRLEVTPTVGGHEDAVLRILSGSTPLDIDSMGFSANNQTSFENIISKPYGLILCVGPTGSGKTTTLHSALSHINKPDRKIWTAEDPVEITQKGLRQVQVNAKIGFTFEEALRSFLRADPDIIMIGEMRDPTTAKIALEASLTGHLVLSTLHTNSAAETVTRLMEIGLEPYHFADVFLGILAQRLGLRLCSACKEAYHPDREAYDSLVHYYGQDYFEKDNLPAYDDNLTLMRYKGCKKCGDSGYKGRVGIHELLTGSPEVKNAIRSSVPVNDIQEIAMGNGMRTLTMDGIYKVFQGETDIMQVNRVVVKS